MNVWLALAVQRAGRVRQDVQVPAEEEPRVRLLLRDAELVSAVGSTGGRCTVMSRAKWSLTEGVVVVISHSRRTRSGWVPKSAILPFTEDIGVLKTAKKYNTQLMQKALEEAKFILDGTDGAGVRFYDRMYVRDLSLLSF